MNALGGIRGLISFKRRPQMQIAESLQVCIVVPAPTHTETQIHTLNCVMAGE